MVLAFAICATKLFLRITIMTAVVPTDIAALAATIQRRDSARIIIIILRPRKDIKLHNTPTHISGIDLSV
jgi:hypothetical protein